MIRAIIFDCFGVLTSDAWLPYKDKHFGRDEALFDAATALAHRSETGQISYEDFVEGVAKLAGMPPIQAYQEIARNVANAPLFELIARELKPHYKLGILSNAAANWLDELFTPDQLALFDAIALSYELGALKPEATVYRAIAERLGVAPQDCLFIDDQPAYCDGARAVGMRAHVYADVADLKQHLPELLV